MTLGGWINMLLSIGVVGTILVWCIRRVIARGRADRELGQTRGADEDEIKPR